ncbi:MAG: DUF4974 domain-containing protein [Tannerella sp.]|jgi:ferric-dicitrate binding protein FerR (iron transport regulator)|nr:DUF4974 domain-containing protein [Tannerella sp.]
MSKTDNIESYIVRYLHGEIAEDELRELTEWLELAPENKEMFFDLKGAHDRMIKHRIVSDDELERSWQRMQQRIVAQPVKPSIAVPKTPKRKAIVIALSYIAAASAAVLIYLGISALIEHRGQADEPALAVVYNEISVPKGSTPNTVKLSDGSIVHLNAASSLRYPSTFDDDMRAVWLDGEAYFEVTADSLHQFAVHLKQQDVIVRGTKFNVEAYHDGEYSIVTLAEGSVALVSSDENGDNATRIRLRPGQKAHFDRKTGKVAVEEANVELANSWIRGEYKFKDEPLLLIAQRLEKYYDISIRFDDEKAEKVCFTGTFSLRQNIDEVMRIINSERQFRYSRSGNEIHIKSRQY